jgi:hypothetical protein
LAALMLLTLVLGVMGAGLGVDLVQLFAAAAELIYLGTVPRNERFRRAVRSRKAAERREPLSNKEIYRRLTRENQKRYVRLRNLKESIRANYRKLSYASQGLLDSHLDKIDGLLDSYLRLLHQKERYHEHADSAAESEVNRSIDMLEKKMTGDSERVNSINKRRLRVLKQRRASFSESRENRKIIAAQLETITDTVKYIHEQSWTLNNPDEITLQLDTLLDEIEETQASVAEVEEVFTAPSSSGDLLDDVGDYDLDNRVNDQGGKRESDSEPSSRVQR